MLLTMLFQATAAAAGVSKLGAALGAGLAVIGAGLGIGKIGGSAMEAIGVMVFLGKIQVQIIKQVLQQIIVLRKVCGKCLTRMMTTGSLNGFIVVISSCRMCSKSMVQRKMEVKILSWGIWHQ
jgi:F0F1-type ATP synthase membrane subunit c/vacuolar-type H+-ATPase subunit K